MKIKLSVQRDRDGRPWAWRVWCPVCGHEDFHEANWRWPSPLHGAVHEDAYWRAVQMWRDHYPVGGDCRDWGAR